MTLTAARLPSLILPHRLDPWRRAHPGRLGTLDALVDAVELENLDAGPDAPLRPHLFLLGVRLATALEREIPTTGGALHDVLMDAQEPWLRAGVEEAE